MICDLRWSAVLGLAAVGLAACTTDAHVIELEAAPGQEVTLTPPREARPERLVRYRWEIAQRPEGSRSEAPPGDGAQATFTPDRRGGYVVDRWLETGLADDLTHRFAITVAGRAPVARITTNPVVAAGSAGTLDGAGSDSLEGLRLRYQWRLVSRPAGSQAALTVADEVQVMVVTDVAGDYVLELAVFDGELWSLPVLGSLLATPP